MAGSYRGIIEKIIIMLEKTLPSSMRENSFLLRSIFWFATEPKKRLNFWLQATKFPCNLSFWFDPSSYKLGHTQQHSVIKWKGYILNSAQVVLKALVTWGSGPVCLYYIAFFFLTPQPMVSESSLWPIDCGKINWAWFYKCFCKAYRLYIKVNSCTMKGPLWNVPERLW